MAFLLLWIWAGVWAYRVLVLVRKEKKEDRSWQEGGRFRTR